MTKKVRIENADTSNYKVVVEVWDKYGDTGASVLVETVHLDNPTDMTPNNLYLTSSRYLIVKEVS